MAPHFKKSSPIFSGFLFVAVLSAVLFVGVFTPGPTRRAHASVLDNLSLTCQQCGNCTLDDFLFAGNNIFNFIIALLGSVSLLAIVVGGTFLVVSHGNENLVSSGKSVIRGALTGLAVGLLSWFIVNFVVTAVAGKGTLFGKQWFKFENSEPQECYPPENDVFPPGQVPPGVNPDTSAWILAGINPAQKEDASPELANLINCIYRRIPSMRINSISDDDIHTGRCDVNKCNRLAMSSGLCPANNACSNDAKCVHTCGSCHYAQGAAPGTHFSEAVDIDDTGNRAAILQAVTACGGKIFEHTGHIHASTQACQGL